MLLVNLIGQSTDYDYFSYSFIFLKCWLRSLFGRRNKIVNSGEYKNMQKLV